MERPSIVALDEAAYRAALDLRARGIRADYTIAQLPTVAVGLTTDLLPIYRNGQTYQLTLGQFPYISTTSYPGLQLNGLEGAGFGNDIREVNGTTWITSNAQWSNTSAGFIQIKSGSASYAMTISAANGVQFLYAQAGAATPISWTNYAQVGLLGQFMPGASGGVGAPAVYGNTGTPVGTLVAANASLYLRFDGTTGSRLYVNTSGASTNGSAWTAVSGV